MSRKKPQAPVIMTYDPHVSSPFMSSSCQLQPMSPKTKWFINLSSVTSIKIQPPSKSFRCFPYSHSTRAIAIQTSYGKTLLLRARKESELDRWFFVLYKMWSLQYNRQAELEGDRAMDQAQWSPALNSQLSAQQQSMNLYQKYLQKQYQLGAQHLRSIQQQQQQQQHQMRLQQPEGPQSPRSQHQQEPDELDHQSQYSRPKGEKTDGNAKEQALLETYQLPEPRISAFLPQGLDWALPGEEEETGELPIMLSSSFQDLIKAAENESENSQHRPDGAPNQSGLSYPLLTKALTPQHSEMHPQELSGPSGLLGQPNADMHSGNQFGHVGPLLEPSKAALIDHWRRSLVMPAYLEGAAGYRNDGVEDENNGDNDDDDDDDDEDGHDEEKDEEGELCDKKQEAFHFTHEGTSTLRATSHAAALDHTIHQESTLINPKMADVSAIEGEDETKSASRWLFSKSEYVHPHPPSRCDNSVSGTESSEEEEEDNSPCTKPNSQHQRRGLSLRNLPNKPLQQQQQVSDRISSQPNMHSPSIGKGEPSGTSGEGGIFSSFLQRKSMHRLRPQAASSDGESDSKSAANDHTPFQSALGHRRSTLTPSEPNTPEQHGHPPQPITTGIATVAAAAVQESTDVPIHLHHQPQGSSSAMGSQVGLRRSSRQSGSVPMATETRAEIGLGITTPDNQDAYTPSNSRRPARLRVDTGPFVASAATAGAVSARSALASQNHSPSSAGILSAASSTSFHTAERGLPSPLPPFMPTQPQPQFQPDPQPFSERRPSCSHSTASQGSSAFLLTSAFQPVEDLPFPAPTFLGDEASFSTAVSTTHTPYTMSRVPQLSMESLLHTSQAAHGSIGGGVGYPTGYIHGREDDHVTKNTLSGHHDDEDDDDRPLAHTLTRQKSPLPFHANPSLRQQTPLTPVTPAAENAFQSRGGSALSSSSSIGHTSGLKHNPQQHQHQHPDLKVVTQKQYHATPPLTSASSLAQQVPFSASSHASPSLQSRSQQQKQQRMQAARVSPGGTSADPMESFSYF
ncbi:hypothetical protein BGW41_004503 [Actinomortierella wolfii]|nr:hypothetical protein BGW41_004503 [Actinomortierella wolfii]